MSFNFHTNFLVYDLNLPGVFSTIDTDTLIRQKVMKTDPINNRCYVRKSNKP